MAYFQFSNFPVQSISVILAGGGHKVIHKKMSLMLNETSFKLNLVNCVAIIINFVSCIQIPQNLAELWMETIIYSSWNLYWYDYKGFWCCYLQSYHFQVDNSLFHILFIYCRQMMNVMWDLFIDHSRRDNSLHPWVYLKGNWY